MHIFRIWSPHAVEMRYAISAIHVILYILSTEYGWLFTGWPDCLPLGWIDLCFDHSTLWANLPRKIWIKVNPILETTNSMTILKEVGRMKWSIIFVGSTDRRPSYAEIKTQLHVCCNLNGLNHSSSVTSRAFIVGSIYRTGSPGSGFRQESWICLR